MKKWQEIEESDLDLVRDVLKGLVEFYKEKEPKATLSISSLENCLQFGLPEAEDLEEHK